MQLSGIQRVMRSLQASLPPLLDNTLELTGETQKRRGNSSHDESGSHSSGSHSSGSYRLPCSSKVAGFRDAPVIARRFAPVLALRLLYTEKGKNWQRSP